MIKNERQYRISKAQAEKFERALAELGNDPKRLEGMHPSLSQAHVDSLRSQLDELREEIEEYEALVSGRYKVLEIESLAELPRALIKARIASGLTQKDLADRLGMKEQQVQRYEATDYEGASLTRLTEIIRALGVQVTEELFLPNAQPSLARLLDRLIEAGLDKQLIVERLLPHEFLTSIQHGLATDIDDENLAIRTASIVGKIFGWSPAAIFGDSPLQLRTAAAGLARFKMSSRVDRDYLNLYITYAHQLAHLTLEASKDLPQQQISVDASEVWRSVTNHYGNLTFESILNYVWDLGIPVLPLDDSGAFHGACWREHGRNIIVLKQRTATSSRWAFDLLHEARHTAENPAESEFALVEVSDNFQSDAELLDREFEANRYAGDVLLNGRAEELAELCVQRSQGKLEWLKGSVQGVASQEGVSVATLANYMAYRLSLQGENWWGTAANLQEDVANHLEIARGVFFQRVNLRNLHGSDRELLVRALSNIPG